MSEKITLTMGGLVPRTVTIEIERPLTGADHAILSTELIGILRRHFERDMGAIRVGEIDEEERMEIQWMVRALTRRTTRALNAARAFWRKRDAIRRERVEATAIVRRYLESCDHPLERQQSGRDDTWCSRCGAIRGPGWPAQWTLPRLATVSPWEDLP